MRAPPPSPAAADHQALADDLNECVQQLIRDRGDGLEKLGMLEYWLQVEIWRALGLGLWPAFAPVIIGELPYKTAGASGSTGFNYCDLVLVRSGLTFWVEMKDLGRSDHCTKRNAVSFVRKNLRALAKIDVAGTLKELAKPADLAHPALRDRDRQEPRREAGARIADNPRQLCGGICLVPKDGGVPPAAVEELLRVRTTPGRAVASNRSATAWPNLEVITLAFAPDAGGAAAPQSALVATIV